LGLGDKTLKGMSMKKLFQLMAVVIVTAALCLCGGCDKDVDVDIDGTDIWTPNPRPK
jgi:hypothetical protein